MAPKESSGVVAHEQWLHENPAEPLLSNNGSKRIRPSRCSQTMAPKESGRAVAHGQWLQKNPAEPLIAVGSANGFCSGHCAGATASAVTRAPIWSLYFLEAPHAPHYDGAAGVLVGGGTRGLVPCRLLRAGEDDEVPFIHRAAQVHIVGRLQQALLDGAFDGIHYRRRLRRNPVARALRTKKARSARCAAG